MGEKGRGREWRKGENEREGGREEEGREGERGKNSVFEHLLLTVAFK